MNLKNASLGGILTQNGSPPVDSNISPIFSIFKTRIDISSGILLAAAGYVQVLLDKVPDLDLLRGLNLADRVFACLHPARYGLGRYADLPSDIFVR